MNRLARGARCERGPEGVEAGSLYYISVILDAWSHRVVGYAINRSIDADARCPFRRDRGEKAAAWLRHHSDRGSQYAAKAYRAYLADHGIEGSMGRRGNPYGRKLHEDPEGRGRLSNGVRDTCRRRRKYPPIHRRRVQCPKATLSSRLYQSCPI